MARLISKNPTITAIHLPLFAFFNHITKASRPNFREAMEAKAI
jgi:hypothetical protein